MQMLKVYSAEIMITEAAYTTYALYNRYWHYDSTFYGYVAPVCSGNELELLCTLTSGRVLEQSISLMLPEDQTFEHVDTVTPIFPIHTLYATDNSSVLFTFSRISPPNSQSLISRLLISPATSIINGTEVACADRKTRNSSSTAVNAVVNNTNMGTLTVSLQLNGTNSYHIHITPEELNIPVTKLVQYDTLYNVSIAVCGESSGSLIGLYCLEKISELRSVNVLTAAISLPVVAVLVIIILTFVVEFVCGHYFGRKSKRSSKETPDDPTGNQLAPLYEDVLLSDLKHQEQDFELKENVAYGPSKSIIKSVN